MGRSRSVHVVLALAATTFCVAFAVLAGQAARQPPAASPRQAAAVSSQAPQAAAGYAGEATCLTCHAEMARGYHDSAHGRAANARTPRATRGCESCHGPGSAHVEDPAANPVLQFLEVEPRAASQACLTCHRRGEHALWDGSAHESRDLSCSTCHSIHSPKSGAAPPGLTPASTDPPGGGSQGGGGTAGLSPHGSGSQLNAASEMELCSRCHRDKVVKLDRSGHMPVREGKMQCSTCHNPHGATNERLLRAGTTPTEACSRCHADKRGPFLWEHAPVTESCATCHDPHGSANERMLVAKLPMLCQRCHIHTRHPSTIYDAAVMGTSNRLYGRSCVTCHSNIHGSNHASGNMFVR